MIEDLLQQQLAETKRTNELLTQLLGRHEPRLMAMGTAAAAVDLNRATLKKKAASWNLTRYGTGRTARVDLDEILGKLAAEGRPRLRAIGGPR